MILPLEKQVSSLEPSKRLKELGVKQESLFCYDSYGFLILFGNGIGHGSESASAFTVAELGEMLPSMTESKHYPSDFGEHDGQNWGCSAFESAGNLIISAETEADARAKMLIHLIEKGIVKP